MDTNEFTMVSRELADLREIFVMVTGKIASLEERTEALEQIVAHMAKTLASQREVAATGLMPLSRAASVLGFSTPTSNGEKKLRWRIGREKVYRPGIEAIDRRIPGGKHALWYLDIEACLVRERFLTKEIHES